MITITGYAFTPFGWQEPGLRGYIYADNMNETIIVAFKGTSVTGPFQTPDEIQTDADDVQQARPCHSRLMLG